MSPEDKTVQAARDISPLVLRASRFGFGLYFAAALYILHRRLFPESALTPVWIVYLGLIYALAEHFYAVFRRGQIDMTFAFPLLLATYVLNLASLLLGGQEKLPLLNRVEHFASFVLLAYVLSAFFSEYVPTVAQVHPYFAALLLFALTSLFGVMNELFELFFDSVLHTNYVGDGFDTSLDLLMNSLGSGLLLAVQLILRGSKLSS